MTNAFFRLSLKDRLAQKILLWIRPAIAAHFLKKVFRVSRLVVNTEAGRFYVDPVSHFGRAITLFGNYEPDLSQALHVLLKPSAVFMDVGANEGYFSIMAAELIGPSGKVITVEPQKRLRAVLEKNFELNDVRNGLIIDSAISDTKGVSVLHISPDTATGSTALHQSTRYKLPTDRVETITLSDLLALAGVEYIDVMKMDIEGFEYEAIMGSKEVFQTHRIKALALELHPGSITKRGLDPDDITSFLQDCGYELDNRFSNMVWTTKNSGELLS